MNLSQRVYELVAKVPKGKVVTYSELARAVGRPTASRAIGQILNKNPNPVVVPCHRVVKSNGNVGGYALGTARKLSLLEDEGVRVSEGKILNFQETNFHFQVALT
jgi:methylated-DNA-[protein]-cysteine S-methyltransferase